MEPAQQQKKDIYAGIVDVVIITIALLISTILLIQHNNTVQVTIDTREDPLFQTGRPRG